MATITILTGPHPSGKTAYARAWEAEDPDNRAIARDLVGAQIFAARGFDVVVDLDTPYTVEVLEFTHDPDLRA